MDTRRSYYLQCNQDDFSELMLRHASLIPATFLTSRQRMTMLQPR